MRTAVKRLAKGAVGPVGQRLALPARRPHAAAFPAGPRWPATATRTRSTCVIVGAGAGGSTLAQRLARRGWRIVVLESGPFWDPDRDWVSDEAGSHKLYWTAKRMIGGADPVELGKNNSGHGVGGSMVHYAGYAPRFHPSDFETRSRDGVGADWPIGYQELRPHYERVEAELPVAGQDWPWGDPHRYPHAAHPVSGGADRARAGAREAGIEMRVGPVAIPNGVFGNRPHCIYRGFCLQGCKVNAKASPLITHLPDAIAHGVEVRADSHAVRVEIDETGRCTGVTYMRDGRERFQRAAAVAVAGYSIETPRLLLNSTSARWPHGLANAHDQVGRYIMVQGAPQVAGRFPDLLRQYKAPPPEISSEQFYETDPAPRVRARLLDPDRRTAADRLGRARARRRPLGPRAARVHARLQPLVHARRAQRAAPAPRQPRHARRTRPTATACRSPAWTTRQSDNDRANIAYAKRVLHDDLGGRRRPGHADHRPLRPPRRRLPHGHLAREQRHRRRPPRLGRAEPLHRRRQRDADPGLREPGADDHGARLAPRRAPGSQARRADRPPRGRGARMPDLHIPVWVAATHFLNLLFLTLLARSGVEVLSALPKLYLSDHCPPGREVVRFSKKVFCADSREPWSSLDEEESWSPVIALPGRKNLGLARHWHFMTVQFWILTGLVYVALLFATGEWRRLVPTSWSIVPGRLPRRRDLPQRAPRRAQAGPRLQRAAAAGLLRGGLPARAVSDRHRARRCHRRSSPASRATRACSAASRPPGRCTSSACAPSPPSSSCTP